MERIVYRKTLDVHKNGIQFTLQGFETVDKMARKLEISLMASGDTIDFPLEKIVAIMYVTTPNATEPSINECTIKDNKIICDVMPIVEEGITEIQFKLIETSPEGAKSVLATPKFAIEVSKSNTDDEGAMSTTTYTALEDAIAKAKGVYEERFIRMELDSDCMFRAYYADGTVYESDVLRELFAKGDALVSESYAKGGTGIRTGEDTDNSKYYSQVSKSASVEANASVKQAEELLEETRKHGVYTAFSVDFETGEVEYVSPSYKFNIDKENGQLEAIENAYTFEEAIQLVVTEWLVENGADINALKETTTQNTNEILDLKSRIENDEQMLQGTYEIAQSNSKQIETIDSLSVRNMNDIASMESDFGTRIGETNERVTDVEENVANLITSGVVLLNTMDSSYTCTYEKCSNGKFEIYGKVLVRNHGDVPIVYSDTYEIQGVEFAEILNITVTIGQCYSLSGVGGEDTHGKEGSISAMACVDANNNIEIQVSNGNNGEGLHDEVPVYVRIIGKWK